MGKVCSNLPANIVGPFEQTLFLGCSVKSFSSSVGWNDQETSITVELIEDPCKPLTHKMYYPKPGSAKKWYKKDPGFQTPDVGAPVYFRVGSFEFAGLVRSWTRKDDASNFPTYSVTISDPRFILENLTIITGEYAGDVKNVPNLVNAYGFLESISSSVCQLDDGLDCRDCNDTFLNGSQFGSPAEGFGGSNQNDQGVPWIRLREAIQLLLSGFPNPEYSPKGFATYRGHIGAQDGIPQPAYSMGRLQPDSTNQTIVTDFGGNGKLNNYYIDITEIPFAPTYYRIESSSQTLLSLISQVCGDAGCDFYIELMVTNQLQKVIKVRTVKRRSQPALGQIAQFLSDQNDYLISKNYGNELRNEPTSVFIYGDNVQSIYEVVPTGASGTIDLTSSSAQVLQHWGFDSEGDFQEATFFEGDRYFQSGLSEWDVTVDFRPLQRSLSSPLVDGFGNPISTYKVSETEIRAAMGSFNAWYNYTLFVGVTGTKDNFVSLLYGTQFGQLLKFPTNYGTSLPFGGLKGKLHEAAPSNLVAQALPPNVTIDYSGSLAKPVGNMKKDLEAIHSYIKAIGDENYGKKFVVKMPEICYYKDTAQSELNIFSDIPTNGGYPASGVSGVLGLPLKGTGIERFEEPDTFKVRGIAQYSIPSLTAISSGDLVLDGSDYTILDSGIYAPLTAEGKNYLYPTGGGGVVPAAIVEINNPIFSGKPEAVQYNSAYFIEKMPGGSGALPSGVKTSGDIFGTTIRNMMGVMPEMYPPSGFAIPMLSNTNRYGPWGFVGPDGPVRFESDTELAPWNYGGYDLLNTGAIEKVQDGLTFQQVGERGAFSLVGYPVKSLGQDLRSPQTSFNNRILTTQATNYGTYNYIPTTPMDGSFGPNITSINISIGEGGATTNYELSTFTPSFGRMSKLNANRLKQIKELRAKQRKQERDNKKLLAVKEKAQGRTLLNKLKQDIQSLIPEDNKNQVKNLMVGASAKIDEQGDLEGEDLCIAGGSDNQILARQQGTNDEQFQKTAIMSQEGMFRSVSKSGDGGLPGYVTSTTVVSGNEAHSQDPMGPINEWTMPIVARDYLDPMASSGTPKHCVSGDEGSYHDIHQVAFGQSIDQSDGYGTTSIRDYIENGNDCPNDFRFMAMRGPLVVNGWGYDLQGKPIPNEVDDPEQARSGNYESAGLTDNFLSGWLKRSRTWPTAPVDLRFDRQRGVWTVPNSFRIVHAQVSGGGIDVGNNGTAVITNAPTIYDSGGTGVDQPTINLHVPDFMPTGLGEDSGCFAYYDTHDSKWYAFYNTDRVGTGTGGGGGTDTNTRTEFKDGDYCTYTAYETTCTEYDCITYGSGLRLTNDGGGGAKPDGTVNAAFFVTDEDYCSYNGAVANRWFDHLRFRHGLTITDNDCEPYIDVNLQLKNSDTCGQNTPVDNYKKFAQLNFADGMLLEEVTEDCEYKVKTNIQLKDSESEAVIIAKYPLNVNNYERFSKVNFGDNIIVEEDTDECEYTVHGLSQTIHGTQTCGLGSGVNGVFERLTFASGLTAVDDGNLNWTINTNISLKDTEAASDINSTYPITVTGYERFSKLNFGDNLIVAENTDQCEYTIKGLDQTLSSEATCGESAVSSHTFERLIASSGLHVTSEAGLTSKIKKIMKAYDCDDAQVGGDSISKITFGRQLKVSADGACGIKVELDKDICPEAGATVTVVKDICCSGSGLGIVYQDLVFTSEGLFSGTANVGSC